MAFVSFSTTWLFIITVVLFVLFYSKVFQTAEKSVKQEGFDQTIIPVEQGQERFNEFMNLVNIANPQVPLSSSIQTAVDQSTNTPEFSVGTDVNGLPGRYLPQGATDPYKIPSSQPSILTTAQTICEKIKNPDCSAFQDPNFVQNCGISFDMNSVNSKGEPQMGGLYISQQDRTNQLQQAHRMGLSPNQIRFTPSLGKAKKGLFAVDAKSCTVLSEQLACKRNHTLGTGNCAQCYTSSDFSRVDPSTPRIPPSLVLVTNSTSISIQWANADKPVSYDVTPDTPITVDVNGTEGDIMYIQVKGNPVILYLAGYITGKTAKGSFSMDINNLVDIDTVTNYKPRIGGTKDVNKIRCFVLRPGMGNNTLNVRLHLPFSFLSPYEYDAEMCDNGPIITQQASADFLGTDPCFGPNNKPGSYSLSCLQQLFLRIGGTTGGSGYPANQEKANQLLFDANKQPRQLNQITDYLYDLNIQASTGKDQQGTSLSISAWNFASMFCTGKPITSPCDVLNKDSGPLSQSCLQYLYNNGGISNAIGATYTMGQQFASKDNQGNYVYCTAQGRLSPTSVSGVQKGQATGGVAAVKNLYDNAFKRAHDNTLSNSDREQAMLDCYGTVLNQQNPEVYWVGPNYQYTQSQAQSVCAAYGAQVATSAQLQQAQASGADWCSSGWVSDNPTPQYPINESTGTGCGNGSPGIKYYMPGGNIAGVTCYGPKPKLQDVQSKVAFFNLKRGQWNMSS